MKVTILCGESPLPVCQALRTLDATEVVIIHGTNESKWTAGRVKEYCKTELEIQEDEIHLVEIDPFHPYKIEKSIFDAYESKADLLDNSSLVFGPGTSAMNVMVHDVWRSKKGNQWGSGQSWYVQALPPQLLPTDQTLNKQAMLIKSTGLSSEKLIRLHIPEEHEHKVSPLKRAIPQMPEEVVRQVENCLYLGKDLNQATQEFLNNAIGLRGRGEFLEVVIFEVMRKNLEKVEVSHSVKTTTGGQNVLEMDVLLRNEEGDACIWISCHTSASKDTLSTEFRKKYFEAKANAERLSGKESRSITIVSRSSTTKRARKNEVPYTFTNRMQNGPKLRKLLNLPEKPTLANRHIIIDLAELLGEDPVAAVGNRELIKQSWVNEWILGAFRPV